MKRWLQMLHGKLGDFWWYSLMLFCASRVADLMNVFVGLYLVPKYVGQTELGAVMPLTSFAAALGIPIGVFATTFMKEVNRLASRQEYGQLKSLLRGVFIFAAALLVALVLVTHFILPHFLERIRIAKGSLGILIIAASLVGSAAPIYLNTLQALKKFSALSIVNLLGAPIRLVTMLVAMPFRPLAGYFVGQASPHAFSILTALVALRHELAVRAEAYWSNEVLRRLGRFMLFIAIYNGCQGLAVLVEQSVLRQRLPDIESAAYYLVTRYSDIANFLSITLLATLFPFTAERADKGLATYPQVLKAFLAIALTNALLAIGFYCFGEPALRILPEGENYAGYSWAILANIAINTIVALTTLHVSTEISAARFSFLKWFVPVNLVYPMLLLFVTGYGYFEQLLPASVAEFVDCVQIRSLVAMTWWMVGFAVVRALFTAAELLRQARAYGRRK